jgi:hypothetical protein
MEKTDLQLVLERCLQIELSIASLRYEITQMRKELVCSCNGTTKAPTMTTGELNFEGFGTLKNVKEFKRS